MEIHDFINVQRPKLIKYLKSYLSEKISHEEMQDYINYVFNEWEKLNLNKQDSYAKNESAFWCTIWSTQHLADEEHWTDGITQRDLKELLRIIESQTPLPNGYIGKRP